MTIDEAKVIVTSFYQEYPGLLPVSVYLRETQGEIWGDESYQTHGKISGAYFPSKGKIAIPVANVDSEDDLRRTLRHELLGHFGVNTLSRREKLNLLNGILRTESEPSLKIAWSRINKAYPYAPPLIKAEEIFCLISEHHFLIPIGSAEKSFEDICEAGFRMPSRTDLENISIIISAGLADRSRVQQVFPIDDYNPLRVSKHKNPTGNIYSP